MHKFRPMPDNSGESPYRQTGVDEQKNAAVALVRVIRVRCVKRNLFRFEKGTRSLVAMKQNKNKKPTTQ